MISFDAIVIGSGPGGQQAALQLRNGGLRVAIVERERIVGGTCVTRGSIPSKTLRESAEQLRQLERSRGIFDFGLKPNVEISEMVSRVGSVIRAHSRHHALRLERAGVRHIHGKAKFAGFDTSGAKRRPLLEVVHPGGETATLSASAVVVATGARPRVPEDIPVDHESILDSDSILSMTYLPESLAVLGAGVVAWEYASMFSMLGTKVTVINRKERALRFLDEDLSHRLLQTIQAKGGRFIGGVEAKSVEWDGFSSVRCELDNGEVVETERMLVAVGRVANVERLGLDAIGLTTNEKGVLEVDEFGRTEVEGVYAVGDVIGGRTLACAAQDEGRRAACHILGEGRGPEVNLIPTGIYTVPEIACVGMDEATAAEKHGELLIGRAELREVARGQITGNTDGFLKLISDVEGKLLGVQIICEGATELIHVGQMGMLADCTIDWFLDNIFNFPTLCEAYRVAALEISAQRERLQAPLRRVV